MQDNNKPTSTPLPCAVDLERSVLGAMLLDAKAVDEVFSVLKTPKVFYEPKHQKICTAIEDLYQRGTGVDLLTVSEQLRGMKKLEEVGGDYYLVSLSTKVASSAHVGFHCRILLQKYILRSIIGMNNHINALAYDDATDSLELLDRYQREFDKITDLTVSGRSTMSLPQALQSIKLDIERHSSYKGDVPMVGIPTGFKNTDKHTGGYREGDLVILAARPGMGKTSKVLKTVLENLKQNIPVGFVSLEMSMKQLTARMVAIDTNFHLKQILKTGFEKTEYFQTYDAHCSRMAKYPFFCDDSGTNDLTEIVIRAKAWKRSQNIGLLVIDYLQLMDDRTIKGSNREAVTSAISRRLKLLAKELEIPVIALSQLSRAVETRGGSKRPVLSDLRDSGAIEQDADIVEFIYRPGAYGLDIDATEYDDKQARQIAMGANTEIIYAKYRAGSVAACMLRWVGDKTKFMDVEDASETLEYIDRPLQGISAAEAFDEVTTVFDA